MKHSEEFVRLVEGLKSEVKEIGLEEAKEKLKVNPEAKLIDVREDHEWHAGHATGAIHLGRGIIERDIVSEIPNKKTELILYCGGGYRSILAAYHLQKMGYEQVFSLIGGYRVMQEMNYPIIKEVS